MVQDSPSGRSLSSAELAENERIFSGEIVTDEQANREYIANLRAVPRVFSEDDLRGMTDFDSVLASFGDDIEYSEDVIGTGAELLQDKDELLGKPFICLQWDFTESKEYPGSFFVTVEILCKGANERYIINDGSKGGVRDQLAKLTHVHGRKTKLVCSKGLRKSTYDVKDADGKKTGSGTSYYIA